MLVLLVPALNLLFRYVDARVGGIVIAVIVGHTAWHWLGERFTALGVLRRAAVARLTAACATCWLVRFDRIGDASQNSSAGAAGVCAIG